MADKTSAIAKLLERQLSVPPSLTITVATRGHLDSFLAGLPHVDHWYLRFDDRQASTVPRVCKTDALGPVLDQAFNQYVGISVVVQERVTAQRSGVLAALPSSIYVEYIEGELRALLCLGVSPSRFLAGQTGEIMHLEQNVQEFICDWDDLDFRKRASCALAERPDPSLVGQLQEAVAEVGEVAVLEWIERETGDVVFLDYRTMPQSFLDGGGSRALDFARARYRSFKPNGSEGQPHRLDRPLYEYGDALLGRNRSLRFGYGGLLSHLCVYAADKGILCEVEGHPHDPR